MGATGTLFFSPFPTHSQHTCNRWHAYSYGRAHLEVPQRTPLDLYQQILAANRTHVQTANRKIKRKQDRLAKFMAYMGIPYTAPTFKLQPLRGDEPDCKMAMDCIEEIRFLPPEIVTQILALLPWHSLVAAGMVCRSWNEVASLVDKRRIHEMNVWTLSLLRQKAAYYRVIQRDYSKVHRACCSSKLLDPT